MILPKFTCTAYAVLLCFFLNAQDPTTDSLRNEIHQMEQMDLDSNLCKNYYRIGRRFYRTDVDSFKLYMNKSITCHQENGDDLGRSKAHLTLGQRLMYLGDFDLGLEQVKICLSLNTTEELKAKCIRLKGRILQRSGKYEQAKVYFDQVEKLALERKDTNALGKIYNDLAIYYDYTEDYEKSIDYHFKSGEIDLQRGDTNYYCLSLMNIASLYMHMKEPDKALEYIEERKEHLDPKDLYGVMGYEKHLGHLYILKNDYSSALEHFKKAKELNKEIGYNMEHSTVTHAVAGCLFELGRIEEAKVYSKEALETAKNGRQRNRAILLNADISIASGKCKKALQQMEKIDIQKDYELLMSVHRSKSKAHSCLGMHEKFDLYFDSTMYYADLINNGRKEKEAKRIEATYKLKIKEDSLSILNFQNSQQKNTIRRRNSSLLFGLITAGLLGLLAFYYKKFGESQKELNEILASENEKLVFENKELQLVNSALHEQNLVKTTRPVQGSSKLEIPGVDKIVLIELKNIMYALAEDEGSRVFIEHQNSIWTKLPLKSIKEKLQDDNFVQIFRGIIVNRYFVASINSKTLKMNDGKVLKMSRKYKPDILKSIKN